MNRQPCRALLLLPVCVTSAVLGTSASAQNCEARSGPKPPAVVELYTSEGCSSCPPADRWLSTLKTQDGVLALSFHVNYWNHLGWRDPFATPETTARQYRLKEALGGKYVYTPQVVLNGRDHRGWGGQGARDLTPLPSAAAPGLRLVREGNQVTAQLAASPAHTTLAGYWAVLQDGLVSKVTRGENAGESLRHDHVVSLYQPVEPWPADQAHSARLNLPAGGNARVAFVVTDPGLTRPVQALVLQCTS
ncbi:MAG: DUF1223 domain-containing protein [Hydrogenophaga sp.]|uniref:DUF1223 domain-containing protein n=1 Tax=Hydrogenophaga sp. TaxID=1904254 RepID=UPI002605727C|nr:DUF1223 domain-containing protein [Hydrogenophaga sp.]MCV0437129.1 DUF1223 domain-containing protein [Hydrogenophaga sp.]